MRVLGELPGTATVGISKHIETGQWGMGKMIGGTGCVLPVRGLVLKTLIISQQLYRGFHTEQNMAVKNIYFRRKKVTFAR